MIELAPNEEFRFSENNETGENKLGINENSEVEINGTGDKGHGNGVESMAENENNESGDEGGGGIAGEEEAGERAGELGGENITKIMKMSDMRVYSVCRMRGWSDMINE